MPQGMKNYQFTHVTTIAGNTTKRARPLSFVSCLRNSSLHRISGLQRPVANSGSAVVIQDISCCSESSRQKCNQLTLSYVTALHALKTGARKMRHNTTTSPVSIDAQAFSLKADTQEVPALVAHCGSYTRVRNGPRLSSPVPVEHPQACRMSHQRPTSFAVKGNVSNRIY